MLYVPQKGRVRTQTNMGTVSSSTYGTAVTTGSPATAKGTAVQLIAATSFDAYLVQIIAHGYSASATACEGALDILIGSATEDVLIPNLLMGYCPTEQSANAPPIGKSWIFPLYIPAGSRLAAQAAGARVSTAMRVGIRLWGGCGIPPFRLGRKVTTYGMGTVPNGTSITPGTSGAAGTYTQITAGTSEDHFAFLPSFQVSGDTSLLNRGFLVAIGVGAATEDEIGTWQYETTVEEEMYGPNPEWPAFMDVPSGTRLAMRASAAASSVDGAYNGVIHCVS